MKNSFKKTKKGNSISKKNLFIALIIIFLHQNSFGVQCKSLLNSSKKLTSTEKEDEGDALLVEALVDKINDHSVSYGRYSQSSAKEIVDAFTKARHISSFKELFEETLFLAKEAFDIFSEKNKLRAPQIIALARIESALSAVDQNVQTGKVSYDNAIKMLEDIPVRTRRSGPNSIAIKWVLAEAYYGRGRSKSNQGDIQKAFNLVSSLSGAQKNFMTYKSQKLLEFTLIKLTRKLGRPYYEGKQLRELEFEFGFDLSDWYALKIKPEYKSQIED